MAPQEAAQSTIGAAGSVPKVFSACRTAAVRATNSRVFSRIGPTIFEERASQEFHDLGDPAPDLILLEADGDPNEAEVCRKLRTEQQYVGAIGVWVPADLPSDRLAEWTASGATALLPQSADDVAHLATLRCLLRVRSAENEVASLKARLELTQSALHEAQQEFHQFALHVSHDFQESARAVTVFSQLMQQGQTDQSSHQSEYLGMVLGATHRVRELLDSVLIYAQAAPPVSSYGTVDLKSAVQGAIRELRQEIADSGAQIELDPNLPTVWGAAPQLQQVFRSLINNSIKYRKPEGSAQIAISATGLGAGEWAVLVSDNGIGIAGRYLDSVFAPFKRLHGRSIPGSGMGLAVCRKIVKAHGGRLSVESSPAGSRFAFTLRDTPLPSAFSFQ